MGGGTSDYLDVAAKKAQGISSVFIRVSVWGKYGNWGQWLYRSRIFGVVVMYGVKYSDRGNQERAGRN